MPKSVLGAVSRWNSETVGFLVNIWLTEFLELQWLILQPSLCQEMFTVISFQLPH